MGDVVLWVVSASIIAGVVLPGMLLRVWKGRAAFLSYSIGFALGLVAYVALSTVVAGLDWRIVASLSQTVVARGLMNASNARYLDSLAFLLTATGSGLMGAGIALAIWHWRLHRAAGPDE